MGVTTLAVVPVVTIAVFVLFVSGRSLAVTVTRPFLEHPNLLVGLLVVNGFVLVFRFAAAIHAFAVGGGTLTGRGLLATSIKFVVVVALGASLAVPHWWTASRTAALYDLATHDFAAAPTTVTTAPPTVVTTTSLPPPTTAGPTPTSSTALPATTTAPVSATTLATTTQVTTTSIPSRQQDRLNVLLLGADAGPDRPGLRTDTMIVVSIDPDSGDTAFFSLPRNQVNYPIPPDHPAFDAFECHCFEGHSNTIYQYGLQHPELFPGGPNTGANAAMAIIGHLLGIDIDYYAMVDLLGFVDVIDALGGVTITVTRSITDETYTHPNGSEVEFTLFPGTYEMDGLTALAYARVRRHGDDYQRMGRQRCVLEALAEQADPATLIRALPGLVAALKESLLTDVPVAQWPDLIELAASADTSAIASIRFMPNAPELSGTGDSYLLGTDGKGYWIPNVQLIRDTVAGVLSIPAEVAVDEFGLQPLESVCG